MSTASTTRSSLALMALALAVAACATDGGTTPTGLAPRSPALTLAAAGTVFDIQLRAYPVDPIFPTDPLFGAGNLQIRLGSTIGDSCFPNSPIVPQPGTTRLSLCGRIFNPGGALYRGGGIYQTNLFGDGFVQVATFNGAMPNDPCHRYDLAGSVTVSDAIASDMIVNPSQYQVRVDGSVLGTPTRLAGTFDGRAWGSVAAPTDPYRPGDPYSPGDPYQPSDPYFAAKVCTVAITP